MRIVSCSVGIVLCGLWLVGCGLQGYECYNRADCAAEHFCQRGFCRLKPNNPTDGSPTDTNSTDTDPTDDRVCQQGATRNCEADVANAKKICKQGTQTCHNNAWGACEGVMYAQPEQCNGKDDDCDGKTDNGIVCDCQSKATRPCYTGAAATKGVGICKAGTQVCTEAHTWGRCEGEVLPTTELCNSVDDNCDGTIDEGCPAVCAPSQSAGHLGQPYSHNFNRVAITANKQYIIATSGQTLAMWKYADRTFVRAIQFPQGIQAVVTHPTHAWIAVNLGKIVELWDLENNKKLHSFAVLLQISMIFSEDGKSLFTMGDEGCKWDLQNLQPGKCPQPIKAAPHPVTSTLVYDRLSISSSGKFLIGLRRKEVKVDLYDPGKGEYVETQTLPCSVADVMIAGPEKLHVACNPHGPNAMKVIHWDFAQKKVLKELTISKPGQLPFFQLRLSPKGTYIVNTGAYTLSSFVIDARTGQIIHQLPIEKPLNREALLAADAGFDSTETSLVTVHFDYALHIWELAKPKAIGTIRKTFQRHGKDNQPKIIALSPKGDRYVTADSFLTFWEFQSKSRTDAIVYHASKDIGTVHMLAFHPDGSLVAAATQDSIVRIWDMPTGKLIHELQKHSKGVTNVAFSTDGRSLFSASVGDGTVVEWSVADGKFVRYLAFQDSAGTIAVHPDGKHLALGMRQEIQIVERTTRKIVRTLPHRGTVALRFLPDDVHFVSADYASYITWDWKAGKNLHTFGGYRHGLYQMPIRADGKVVMSYTKTEILFFDPLTGQEIIRFDPSGKLVRSSLKIVEDPYQILAVAFGAFNQFLYTSDSRGELRAWTCSAR